MRELESQVKQGTFDSILIKPVNPYFVSCEQRV
ncbi:ABC-2 family transporter protein [Paenibacillus septentrionalis]